MNGTSEEKPDLEEKRKSFNSSLVGAKHGALPLVEVSAAWVDAKDD